MKDKNFTYWSVHDTVGDCFYDDVLEALKHAKEIGVDHIAEYEVSMWRFKKDPKKFILNCLNGDDFAERIEKKEVN
jgi:hypothetical protein